MPDETASPSSWTTTSSASGGPDNRLDQEFASLAPELSRRIGAILETIQRDAERMLDRAQFSRYLEGTAETAEEAPARAEPPAVDNPLADRQRRLAELADALIDRSEQVLAQLDETARLRESFAGLLNALSDAADRIAVEARRTAALPVPEPPPLAPAAPPSGSTAVDRAWVEARQATIHMAAAGSTRGQVETQLRDFLGVSDPTSLLDQVFGPGSTRDARVPWAIAPATPLRPSR